jgi:hypothetical protein
VPLEPGRLEPVGDRGHGCKKEIGEKERKEKENRAREKRV